MKYFTSAVLLLLSLAAQEPKVEKVRKNWDNGKLRTEYILVDDEIHGTLKYGYESGKDRSETGYIKGIPHGSHWEKYENGQWKEKGNYLDGHKHGDWSLYHDNGRLWEVLNFKAGLRHGDVVRYHRNGKESEKGRYVSDLAEDEWKAWHENGKRRSITRYVKGVKQGSCESFYESGRPKAVFEMAGNLLSGTSIEYFDDATLVEKSNGKYVKGLAEGSWVTRHDNNRKASEVAYKAGQKEGEAKFWYRSGNPSRVETYVAGIHHGTMTEFYDDKIRPPLKKWSMTYVKGVSEGDGFEWYENKRMKSKVAYKGGRRTGRARYWFKSGNLEKDLNLKDSFLHGTCHWYHDEPDRMHYGGEFKDNLREGTHIRMRRNGRLSERAEYRKGRRHGKYEDWDLNGILVKVGPYKDGLKEGKWIEYRTFISKIVGHYVVQYEKDRKVSSTYVKKKDD